VSCKCVSQPDHLSTPPTVAGGMSSHWHIWYVPEDRCMIWNMSVHVTSKKQLRFTNNKTALLCTTKVFTACSENYKKNVARTQNYSPIKPDLRVVNLVYVLRADGRTVLNRLGYERAKKRQVTATFTSHDITRGERSRWNLKLPNSCN
jgi:hypothetical protein